MPLPPNLYKIKIKCIESEIEKIETLFDENTFPNVLSISTFNIPREEKKKVEIITDGKPDKEKLKKHLINFDDFKIEHIKNIDWVKKLSNDFPPITIERWVVFSKAYKNKINNDKIKIQIEATSAFGTGEHPTTKGCLDLLDLLLTKEGDNAKNWSMLDIGCGSGILSIAFAKSLKNAKVIGVDIDKQSVDIANKNLKINNISDQIIFELSDGYNNYKIKENAPYDLIMSNIFADPLCEMAPLLKKHLKKGGKAILSGILETQANKVIKAHQQENLKLIQRKEIGEWSILEFSN